MNSEAEVGEISKKLRDLRNVDTTVTPESVITYPTVVATAVLAERARDQIRVEMSSAGIFIKGNADRLPPWVFPTIQSLTQAIFRGAPLNTPAVNFSTAKYAIELLPVFMSDQSPPPTVSLRGHGGLAFQWSGVNVSLLVLQSAQAYLEVEGKLCMWIDDSGREEVDTFRRQLQQLGDFNIERAETSWLESTKTKLDEFRRLRAGWDQEDARPIRSEIIDAAREFVTGLSHRTFKVPSVVPLSGGTVQFEWRRGRTILAIEVESPSSIHYLKWPEAGEPEENSLPIADSRGIAQLLAWFEDN